MKTVKEKLIKDAIDTPYNAFSGKNVGMFYYEKVAQSVIEEAIKCVKEVCESKDIPSCLFTVPLRNHFISAPVQEMTVAEIEAALGYPIKIIKD